ncbi:MAG: glycosyltransferase family 2 protein, partial [Solirubrobacteraceae bacterium]
MIEPDRPDPSSRAADPGVTDHTLPAPIRVDVRFGLRERIKLTYEYHGVGSLIYRFVTFPLRFTPLKRYLSLTPRNRDNAAARRWYAQHGRPVTIVIPSYRDGASVIALVASLRRTVAPEMAKIIVADDASGPDHVATLRAIPGIDVVEAQVNRGFAANVNRGLQAADPAHDVVLLNSDVVALDGWLERLQYATSRGEEVGGGGAPRLCPGG